MFEFSAVNYVAVVIATAAGMITGAIWYGPLFGKAWLDALGKKPEDLPRSPLPMILSIVLTFIIALALGLLVAALEITTLVGGIVLGLFVGLFFVAANMASDYLFCGWTTRLFVIQASYRLVISVLMAAIIGAWN